MISRNLTIGWTVSILLIVTSNVAAAPATQDSTASAGPPAGEWREGRGENEMVLIHGLGGSNEIWQKVVPYLSGTFNLHTYELHGHGHTQPLENPSIDGEVEALVAWIDEQELVYPTLVGHGLGGMIAMQYTFDHPADVQRLIVIDAGPKQIAAEAHKVAVAEALIDDYDKFVASRFVSISEDREICELAVDWALRTDVASFTTLLMSSFDWDLTDDLARQSVPMLVIGSAAYLPEAGYERSFLEQYGYASARVLSFKRLSGTGHYLMLEKPTYLASVLTVFIRGEE